jgi:Ca2+-binding RTX toxin-like protein
VVDLLGEDGDDTLSGGKADDTLEGGAGNDRLCGYDGRDLILGGQNDDVLIGGNHDDLLFGGEGNDQLLGQNGHDLMFGGLGVDRVQGGAGEDLLIGGATAFDANVAALRSLRAAWTAVDDAATVSNELVAWGLEASVGAPGTVAQRIARLQTGSTTGIKLSKGATIFDDTANDELNGGLDTDARFAFALDQLLANRGDLTL